ncbi:hypothetical protein F4782DRAFT_486649 [Xylaria castorea]|nr:hypothetical protein F4782DRAFT_486649 [Xylaria castorea]
MKTDTIHSINTIIPILFHRLSSLDVKMQPTILLTLLSTVLLSSFPRAVLAAPAEISPRSASLLEIRQYDGPCSHTDCGVTHINCRDRRLWCVAYPSSSMPQGCTCSAL